MTFDFMSMEMALVGIVDRGMAKIESDGQFTCNAQDSVLLKALADRFRRVSLLTSFRLHGSVRPRYPDLSKSLEGQDGIRRTVVAIPGGDIRCGAAFRSLWSHTKRFCNSCDFILVYMPSTLGCIAIAASLILRKPLVLYYGSNWSESFPYSYSELNNIGGLRQKLKALVKDVFEKISYRCGDLLLFRDEVLLTACKRRGLNATYVPGNTTYSLLGPSSNTKKGNDGQVALLTVAEVIPRKGLHDAISAVGILRRSNVDAKYVVAGRGTEENVAYLRRIARSAGVEDLVAFLGQFESQTQLDLLFSEADVFLLPSYSEGLPRVLLEAQGRSVPVVTTRVGGIPIRMKDGEDVLFVNVGKPDEIAHAVLRVIRDPELAENLKSNGLSRVKEELTLKSAAQVITEWWIRRNLDLGG